MKHNGNLDYTLNLLAAWGRGIEASRPVHEDDDDGFSVGEVAFVEQPVQHQVAEHNEISRVLDREMRGMLTPREEAILRARFLHDGERPPTLRDVGKRYGVCRERIRQLEVLAIRKLRDSPALRELFGLREDS